MAILVNNSFSLILINDSFLTQHVLHFIRVRGDDTLSLLNLIFSGNQFDVENLRYEAHIGLSDHAVMIFDFLLEGYIELTEEEFTKYNFFKAVFIPMNEQVAGIDWEHLFNDPNVPKVHINSNLCIMKQKWMTKHALNKDTT